MSGPRTAQGRALVDFWLAGRTHPPSTARREEFVGQVLAIEAAARRAAFEEAPINVDRLEAALWAVLPEDTRRYQDGKPAYRRIVRDDAERIAAAYAAIAEARDRTGEGR